VYCNGKKPRIVPGVAPELVPLVDIVPAGESVAVSIMVLNSHEVRTDATILNEGEGIRPAQGRPGPLLQAERIASRVTKSLRLCAGLARPSAGRGGGSFMGSVLFEARLMQELSFVWKVLSDVPKAI
jgi:hypothetical protein